MSSITLTGPKNPIDVSLKIGGSKSISNRALLISALCKSDIEITNLSNSDDSQTMVNILKEKSGKIFDCHHAGTTFRFLTAYFALQKGAQILTGSQRMKQRPIGPLVNALREIGAQIEYLENEGFPPLKLKSYQKQAASEITIKADISSQFVSALCMIAPTLSDGLTITFEGALVSKPYLDMTLSIMSYFGVKSTFENNTVSIDAQKYIAKNYLVESDWSSASYHYAIAALLPESKITLSYYFEKSLQGDSAIVDMAKHFGITSTFVDSKLIIESNKDCFDLFAYDYIKQPDIAQTFAVMGAAKNMKLYYKGLKTLRIKETDRITALQNELNKVNVNFKKTEYQDYEFMQSGNIQLDFPVFETYQDHRMAMAFAPLAILGSIHIKNPEVVSKSYPDFWDHLKKMGFKKT